MHRYLPNQYKKRKSIVNRIITGAPETVYYAVLLVFALGVDKLKRIEKNFKRWN